MSYQVQLNVQLLDVGKIVQQGANKVVAEIFDFARQLRKTNSDIIVEEDLASVFGRARIVPELQTLFKNNLLKNTRIVPLIHDFPIQLTSCSGPTVDRALTDRDPRYLRTVIQLSFLCRWYTHDGLASALSHCLERRSGLLISSESIKGTLETCSSQTNVAFWDTYVHAVETKLRLQHVSMDGLYTSDQQGINRSMDGMSVTSLLAAMDYFFLIQSLPEDRRMVSRTLKGIVPLVVWAHYILGLCVRVDSDGGNSVTFGDSTKSPDVVAHLSVKHLPEDEEILLLNSGSEIVLRCTPIQEELRLSPGWKERHGLLDYGTEILRRFCNTYVLVQDEDPVYRDIAQIIVAIALNITGLLRYRDSPQKGYHILNLLRPIGIESWRVYEAARIIFHSINIHKEDLNATSKQIRQSPYPQFPFSPSTHRVINSEKFSASKQGERALHMHQLMHNLAYIILIFAHAYEVKTCQNMPLSMEELSPLVPTAFNFEKDYVYVGGHTFICAAWELLLDNSLVSKKPSLIFIVSDHGWSLFKSAIGAADPADVRPLMFHVQQGVPTNTKTGERKRIVEDLNLDEVHWNKRLPAPPVRVVDTGQSYVPRSLARVATRKIFCSSQGNRFSVGVELGVQYDGSDQIFTHMYGYSGFASRVGEVWLTARCQCSRTSLETTSLGLGVATVTGSDWNEHSSTNMDYRICIYLAQEGWARWHALSQVNSRICIIKTKDCCEKCALIATSRLEGKCLLII